MDENRLASRIGQVRTAKGWSIRELARRSGVSVTNLSAIERGTIKNPQYRTQAAIAHALGWSRMEYLEHSDDLEPPERYRYRESGLEQLNFKDAGIDYVAVHGPETRLQDEVNKLSIYSAVAAAQVLFGVDSLPEPIDRRDAPKGYEVRLGPRGIGVIVRGESMGAWAKRPIHDGDIAWINLEDDFDGRGVVVAVIREDEDGEPKVTIKFHDGGRRLFAYPSEKAGERVLFPAQEIIAMRKVIVVSSPDGEP
jgi:transcriptional regulator with XRE-family HTH domain